MSNEIDIKIHNAINEINQQQEIIRRSSRDVPPSFVAHASHVSQDEYRTSASHVFEHFSSETEIVPAFPKATQNELSALKNLRLTLSKEENEQFNAPVSPKRVFAISTKQDDKGTPVFDENGIPVPQDGSYAYSLKKCSASICFVDDGIPLLVGFEKKYEFFESEEKKGHIYIGRGDTFKPEYDNNGNITEYTSTENMMVAYHIQTTPQEAMLHNVQFIMFNNVEDYEKWSDKVKKTKKDFETFISSDDYMITSLQEEISSGRATYINATPRGCNPQISSLIKSSDIARSKKAIGASARRTSQELRDKIKQRDNRSEATPEVPHNNNEMTQTPIALYQHQLKKRAYSG